ncbi:MAG TPA: DUF1416 domain-containing protein [Candidatus Dormibacteraeota bacterium]|jgi:hypothetical protein|nr:DUF1416 domain-containing protein [Candidatus Dormibacteraeota bacterium]
MTYTGCATAPADYVGPTAIRGVVTKDGQPFEGGYVRLRGSQDEFVAEIRTDPSGQFQFFPVAGTWTVIFIAPGDVRDEATVSLQDGEAVDLTFEVAARAATA